MAQRATDTFFRGLVTDDTAFPWFFSSNSPIDDYPTRRKCQFLTPRGNRGSVVEFSTWPKLFQFMARELAGVDVLVKPDGFIRIQGTDANGTFEDMFFLECDRSTEELDILVRRAACYRDYYRGGLASRFGQPRTEFKKFPFVVLMTFKTTERRNNMAERLLLDYPLIRNQVWLCTLAEVTCDPLGVIWVKPRDYAKLTEGTAFDIEQRRDLTTYRRQLAREELIERNIIKHPLFPFF